LPLFYGTATPKQVHTSSTSSTALGNSSVWPQRRQASLCWVCKWIRVVTLRTHRHNTSLSRAPGPLPDSEHALWVLRMKKMRLCSLQRRQGLEALSGLRPAECSSSAYPTCSRIST